MATSRETTVVDVATSTPQQWLSPDALASPSPLTRALEPHGGKARRCFDASPQGFGLVHRLSHQRRQRTFRSPSYRRSRCRSSRSAAVPPSDLKLIQYELLGQNNKQNRFNDKALDRHVKKL